jgi:dipeptidyl aminopeptidase/acylaminoacyl peptidase
VSTVPAVRLRGTPPPPCATLLIALAAAGAAHGEAPAAHRPGNEDLRHVRSLEAPRLSPDGTRVLLAVSDATADGAHSHLWLLEVATDAARQLTYTPPAGTPPIVTRGEYGGNWMPDGGSILFLAKRAEHTQLYRLPLAGGEAQPYDLKVEPAADPTPAAEAVPPPKAGEPAAREPQPLEVEDYAIAPNGRSIAVLAQDPPPPVEKQRRDAKADALRVDHEVHGARLYLLDVATGRLTATAVPPDVKHVSWNRQGDRLIAISDGPNHADDLAAARSGWLLAAADPSHPVRLANLPASLEGGSWSEDGTRYYFHAQCEGDAPPGVSDLYVAMLADAEVRNLTAGFAGSLAGGDPLMDGAGVLAAVTVGTRATYLRLRGGRSETLKFDRGVATQLHTNARHTGWVWLGSSGGEPERVYYATQPGGAGRALHAPEVTGADWQRSAATLVHWQNEGYPIEGLLYLPPEAAHGKVPLVVDVHGGPTYAWHDAYDPLVDWLNAQGWAVLRPNPRGSTGYGRAFAAANKNDLGGADLRDVLSGVDAVLAAYPVDPGRLALIGYSYGGEMAGFAEGKTDRFRAIVSGAPVIDQYSEYGTEDASRYDRWFYGRPWEHPQDAWRQSPLAYVAHAKTPFLLLQGEADSVDPLGQSQEMYRALRQVGVPVELVQYPREDHGPLARGLAGRPSAEPWHGYDARQRIQKFIEAAFDRASAPR